jgi:hypothetical protein
MEKRRRNPLRRHAPTVVVTLDVIEISAVVASHPTAETESLANKSPNWNLQHRPVMNHKSCASPVRDADVAAIVVVVVTLTRPSQEIGRSAKTDARLKNGMKPVANRAGKNLRVIAKIWLVAAMTKRVHNVAAVIADLKIPLRNAAAQDPKRDQKRDPKSLMLQSHLAQTLLS